MATRTQIEDAILLADDEGRVDDVQFLKEQLNQSPESNITAGVIEGLAQGATTSLGEEVGSGVNAGIDQLGQLLGVDLGQGASGQESFGQAFDRRLGESRGRQRQFAGENRALDFGSRLLGGIAPSLATGGGTLGAIAAKEAGLGALEGCGATEDKFSAQGALDTAIGGTLSGAATLGLGKLGRPSRMVDRVGQTISDVAERAEKRAGKRLITRAQEAGSITGDRVEAAIETIPLASSTRRIKDNFQKELTDKAIESIGQTASRSKKLTVDVLQDAKVGLGAKFNKIFSENKISVPKDFADTLIGIAENHSQKIGTSTDKKSINIVIDVADRIRAAMKGGAVDGVSLQKIRSELLDLSRDATGTTKTALKSTIGELTGFIDNTISAGLDGKALSQWRKTNAQWKSLKALTANDFVVNPVTGDVSGKRLFAQLSKQAGGATQIPDSALGDLAKLSKIPGVGDSGTSGRQLLAQAITSSAGLSSGLITGVLPQVLSSVAGIRLLDEVAQRAPARGLGLLAGATSRAGDTSGLLDINEIIGR
jgi:hypothetical protein